MQRLRTLQAHVVGDVHDVIDGPHAGADEARLQPQRRGAHRNAGEHNRGVARAQLGLGHPHCQRQRFTHHLEVRVVRQRMPLDACDHGTGFASEANHAHGVGTVAGDLDVQHGILGRIHLLQRHAQLRALGQHPNAGVVIAHAELVGGAQHTLALHPADSGGGDGAGLAGLRVAHARADAGERHHLPHGNVGGAAHHRLLDTAIVNRRQSQPVGLWMCGDGGDARGDDPAPNRTHLFHPVHGHGVAREHSRKLLRRQLGLQVLFQPVVRNFEIHDGELRIKNYELRIMFGSVAVKF